MFSRPRLWLCHPLLTWTKHLGLADFFSFPTSYERGLIQLFYLPAGRLCKKSWRFVAPIVAHFLHWQLLSSVWLCSKNFKQFDDQENIPCPFSSDIPECWEKRGITHVLFVVKGARFQLVYAHRDRTRVRGRLSLTHILKRTHTPKSRLITCITLTFTLAFISLPSGLWRGILENKHTFTVTVLTLEHLTSDPWGVSTEETVISLRKCVAHWRDLRKVEIVRVWAISAKQEEEDLSPDPAEQALSLY